MSGTSCSRSSSVGACSDTASVTGRSSCARRRMAGATPTVLMVMRRAERPRSSWRRCDRGPRVVVVGERFAHAHEHDVADALRRRLRGTQHLLDDLAGVEVALEPGLAGRAERAAHRAPGLRRHAHRRALGVAHEHGLDLRAVARARPQPLRRHAVVRGLLDERVECEGKRVGEALAQRARQRGGVVERAPAGGTARPTPGRRGSAVRPTRRGARRRRRGRSVPSGEIAWRHEDGPTSRP